MRVELRDGQWAELRERLSHGDRKRLIKAYRAASGDDAATLDCQTLIVALHLRTFHVLDVDGEAIPTDGDREEAVLRFPADIADTLLGEASDVFAENRDPNPPTPPSSDG